MREREKNTAPVDRCKIKKIIVEKNEEGTYKDALHKQAK